MIVISEAKALFGDWIAAVTGAVESLAGRVVRPRRIFLSEGEGGVFTARMMPSKNRPALPDASFRFDGNRIQPPLPPDWAAAFRGSRVEAQVSSHQVMACRLDFPGQAGDFLDGFRPVHAVLPLTFLAPGRILVSNPVCPIVSSRIGD